MQVILEKAKKLQALAERAGTPAEAAVAATKLQELMLRENLSMSQIDSLEEENDYIQDSFTFLDGVRQKLWNAMLYYSIAKTLQCEVVVQSRKKGQKSSVYVVGRKHNIEIIGYLYQYLHGEIVRLGQAALATYKADPYTYATPAAYYRSFCYGAACVVGRKVRECYVKVRDESLDNTALVVQEESRVRAAFEKLHPRTVPYRGKSNISVAGRSDGGVAGESIAVHRGIGRSQHVTLI